MSPTTLSVQNIGGGKVVPVSWRKCKRLGGPELKVSETVKTAAIHDLQKFLVEEFLGWKTVKGVDCVFKGEVAWLQRADVGAAHNPARRRAAIG